MLAKGFEANCLKLRLGEIGHLTLLVNALSRWG
jgi:hypothetical protein